MVCFRVFVDGFVSVPYSFIDPPKMQKERHRLENQTSPQPPGPNFVPFQSP